VNADRHLVCSVVALVCASLAAACATSPEPIATPRLTFDERLPDSTATSSNKPPIALTLVITPAPDETDTAAALDDGTPTPDIPQPTPENAPKISASIARLAQARSYAADLTMTVRGELLSLSGPADGSAPVIDMKTLVEDGRRRITLNGVIAEQLGAPDGIEYTYDRQRLFLRGPAALLQIADDAWYAVPESRAAALSPPFDPLTIARDLLSNPRIDTELRPIGKRNLDTTACDVYQADTNGVIALENDSVLTSEFASIDTAKIEALVCANGYLNVLTFSVSGKTQRDTTQVAGLGLQIRFYDFDQPLGVAVPENAPALPNSAASQQPVAIEGASVLTSTWPTLGAATDIIALPGGDGQLNYVTDADIAAIYTFYGAEFAKLGYAEVKDATRQDATTLTLLMEGKDAATRGTVLVIQARQLAPGSVNVNIRKERS
jgi:hypothetical protein